MKMGQTMSGKTNKFKLIHGHGPLFTPDGPMDNAKFKEIQKFELYFDCDEDVF